MRIIVFFDLPMQTARERRTYALFRKWLLKNGYNMLQFSVYVRLFNNRDAAMKHMAKLRQNAPPAGAMRAMLVTEKQYARMEIIIGGKTHHEEVVTEDPLLIL